MARHLTISEHILETLRRIPDCRLDDLVLKCQDYSLRAVLSEVSHLSRKGELQLTLVSTGSFTVQLLNRDFRPRFVRNHFLMERIRKSDKAKSKNGNNDQEAHVVRRASAHVPRPIPGHLTCNEAELEALMAKGEST